MFIVFSFIALAFGAPPIRDVTFEAAIPDTRINLPESVLKTRTYEENQNVVELHPEVVQEQVTLHSHVPEITFRETSVDTRLPVPHITFNEIKSTSNLKVPTIRFEPKIRNIEQFIPKVDFQPAKTSRTQYVPVVDYVDVPVTRYRLVPRVEHEDIQLTSFQHVPDLNYETRFFNVPRYGIVYQPELRTADVKETQYWPEVV